MHLSSDSVGNLRVVENEIAVPVVVELFAERGYLGSWPRPIHRPAVILAVLRSQEHSPMVAYALPTVLDGLRAHVAHAFVLQFRVQRDR